jgi:long-chain acyl-CoA synthetase
LAVHALGGIHVAVHCSLSGPQIAYQIRDSGAQLAIVSGSDQARKLAAAAAELPPDLAIYSLDPPAGVAIAGSPVLPLADASADAAFNPLEHSPQTTADDLATILYTSGTTGEPKGVMLTHGNLVSNALACLETFCHPADELRLCWLPLSHIYARTSDLYIWIASGTRMALAESRDTILADCAAVHPTFINGVPYFYQKVARYLQDAGRAGEPGALAGLLGGRIRVCCAGGAALPNPVNEFFDHQGVMLVQGYGLTETSPVITTGTPAAHRLGTVGRTIPGVEVRIADDGEILCRGPNVMRGYWNKPQATADVLVDGWFHTGDLGEVDDGFLRITGRKKELIVTAAGKNIAPTFLESLLAEDPLVAQALVVGDGRNYLAALIVPDAEKLRAEIARRQIRVASATEALCCPHVRAIYQECIERRLAGVSYHEQVRAFALLDRGFTVEAGELTPTLKLRRGVVQEHFAEKIAGLYAGSR